MTSQPAAFDPDARRSEIGDAAAQTVLEAAARRLVQAYDEFEDALDRRAPMTELQLLDREVARAEREHAAVAPWHRTT